eukprot:3424137-Prymnesium_polylepis.1
MCILWPVGVPVMYALLLWGSRAALSKGNVTPLSRATSFLSGDYENRAFWWEPLEMCRKLILTGWVLLISEHAEQARVNVALLVSILFIVLRLSLKPLRWYTLREPFDEAPAPVASAEFLAVLDTYTFCCCGGVRAQGSGCCHHDAGGARPHPHVLVCAHDQGVRRIAGRLCDIWLRRNSQWYERHTLSRGVWAQFETHGPPMVLLCMGHACSPLHATHGPSSSEQPHDLPCVACR